MSITSAPEQQVNPTSISHGAVPLSLVWPSLLVALVALAGSLWLSIGMGLKACPLCFYQRTFVMGVVGILGVGALLGQQHRAVLNLLALPLVVGGVGVAIFHVYLEMSGKLECPGGVMGIGTAPQQSLAALATLLLFVGAGAVRSASLGERHGPAAGAGVLLGLLLAWSSVASSPPMPPVPTKAYTTPLDMCRPPFHQP